MNIAERVEFLEEENRQLREMLRTPDSARFPKRWRLSLGEQRVLKSLISSADGYRSHEAICIAGRAHDETWDTRLVHVLISSIRKKLAPHGVLIVTVWGQGYKIDPKSKAIVIGARTREVAQ
jgi:DNA-binding response OmpR family regulator